MPHHTPSSDLRIADLPPDLREEGVRLKAQYHALAEEAGFLSGDGAMDLRKLEDLDTVKKVDFATLRALASTAESLRILQIHAALPMAIRAECTYDIFSSPDFIAEATEYGFSPFQWAGVGYVLFYSKDVRAEMFRPVGDMELLVGGDLPLEASPNLSTLPTGLTVRGSLILTRCASLTELPAGLTVDVHLDLFECTSLLAIPEDLTVGNLTLSDCTSLTTLPAGLTVKGNLALSGCAATIIDQARALKAAGRIHGLILV